MKPFRSSIFSSETLKLRTVPRGFWGSLLVFVLLLVGVEIASRALLAPLGEAAWLYGGDSTRFEWFRRECAEGRPPEVVCLGDSTGARAFAPAEFAKGSEGVSAYNLALPAQFPRAFADITLPLLRDSRVLPPTLLVIQSPASYLDIARANRFEQALLLSPIARRNRGERMVGDFLQMTRLYRVRSQLVAYWRGGRDPMRRPAALGHAPIDRSFEGPLPPAVNDAADPVVSPKKRESLLSLLRLAKDRAIRVIVVLPPELGSRNHASARAHRAWLAGLAADGAFTLWDDTEWSNHRSRFSDERHLNRTGSEIYSRELGRRYAGMPR